MEIAEGLKNEHDETITIFNIINKLPTSWKDFKHGLKHAKEDLSLEELANSL